MRVFRAAGPQQGTGVLAPPRRETLARGAVPHPPPLHLPGLIAVLSMAAHQPNNCKGKYRYFIFKFEDCFLFLEILIFTSARRCGIEAVVVRHYLAGARDGEHLVASKAVAAAQSYPLTRLSAHRVQAAGRRWAGNGTKMMVVQWHLSNHYLKSLVAIRITEEKAVF